jgi:hypothetical protein
MSSMEFGTSLNPKRELRGRNGSQVGGAAVRFRQRPDFRRAQCLFSSGDNFVGNTGTVKGGHIGHIDSHLAVPIQEIREDGPPSDTGVGSP